MKSIEDLRYSHPRIYFIRGLTVSEDTGRPSRGPQPIFRYLRDKSHPWWRVCSGLELNRVLTWSGLDWDRNAFWTGLRSPGRKLPEPSCELKFLEDLHRKCCT